MIDINTGLIVIKKYIDVLSPTLTKYEFQQTNLYDHDGIDIKYTVKIPQNISGKKFIINLYFGEQYLKEVHLYEVGNKINTLWSDWSEDDELNRKKSHDEWLLTLIGKPPYTYSWGEIDSIYDRKGGFSSIIIRYK